MRASTHLSHSRRDVKQFSQQFNRREVETVCRKCGIPKYHWACYLALLNGHRVSTAEFGRRLDARPDYQLALLAIVKLF